MTPSTIILTIAALGFGILWLFSLRTNARLHDIIHTRDEAIEGYKRKNFEAGTAMQRLQSRFDTANEELAGFKAGVKAAATDAAEAIARADKILGGSVASPAMLDVPVATNGKAVVGRLKPTPAVSASAKPTAKAPAKRKPAPKAPARKAAKK